MEIKKRLNLRSVLAVVYFVCFGIFLNIGLRPAEATNYEISAELAIPAIGLTSDVTALELEDHQLDTPDYIVGSFTRAKNKTLLIGHSTTVFSNLNEIKLGDEIFYDETNYKITNIEVLEKPDVDMDKILATEDVDTLVLMTCAGELLTNGDATHRLIITAVIE